MYKFLGLASTLREIVGVAVVVSLLSGGMAQSASADESEKTDAALTVERIASQVPGLAALLDTTDATTADGVLVDGDDDTASSFDSGDHRVDIPVHPAAGVALSNASGMTVTIGLPGNAEDAVVAADGSVLYNNAFEDTDIMVEPQVDGGARMITIMSTDAAPTQFGYHVRLVTGHAIQLTDDGGAAIIGPTGQVVVAVPPPWAYDASGTPVPANYTLEGATLTLNVQPTDSSTPIIADPWWNPWTWSWSKIWSKMRQCGTGAKLALIDQGVAEVSANTARKLAGRRLVAMAGGGYAYVGWAVGACIVNMLK